MNTAVIQTVISHPWQITHQSHHSGGTPVAWRPFASSWLKARFSSLNFSIIVSKNCNCYYPLLVRVSLIITVCWRRSGSETVGVRIFIIVFGPVVLLTRELCILVCVLKVFVRATFRKWSCPLHDKPVLNIHQCRICIRWLCLRTLRCCVPK